MTDVYKAPSADLTEHNSIEGEFGSIEKALAGQYTVDPTERYKRAWENLKGLKTPFWLAGLIYVVMFIAYGLISSGIGTLSFVSGNPVFVVIYSIVDQLLSMLIFGPLGIGIFFLAVRHSIGKRAEPGQLLNYFPEYLIPIFVVTLLSYIAIGLGLLLLIIPGIYLFVGLSFAIPLTVDKGLSATQAMTVSVKAVHRHWFAILGFLLLAIFVNLVGALALIVGLLWTIPLTSLAYASLYRDMFGVEEATVTP